MTPRPTGSRDRGAIPARGIDRDVPPRRGHQLHATLAFMVFAGSKPTPAGVRERGPTEQHPLVGGELRLGSQSTARPHRVGERLARWRDLPDNGRAPDQRDGPGTTGPTHPSNPTFNTQSMTLILDTLQRVPFRRWKLAKQTFRYRFATVPWPDRPTVHLAISAAVLEEQLRRHHFEDASGWSIRYDGEDVNMRRPAGIGTDDRPVEEHLRARESEDGVEVNGHVEPSRWEEKTAHVNEEGLTWLDEAELRTLLEDCGLDPA